MSALDIELLDTSFVAQTVRTTPTGERWATTPGASLRIPVVLLQPTQSEFDYLQNLVDAAGTAAAGADQAGHPWFYDRVRNGADVGSLVVKLTPIDLPDLPAIWAVVDDGDIETTVAATNRAEVRLDVTVLETVSQYGTRIDLQDAAEADLF
jgi:hypothetical protein